MPDRIVPARGPVITEPRRAIRRLTERLRAVYANYLSTTALHWYFKTSHIQACADRTLGPGTTIELEPYTRRESRPDWILASGTTRVILSQTGKAFLLDCGSKAAIEFIDRARRQGVIDGVDGSCGTAALEIVGMPNTPAADDHWPAAFSQ